MSISLHLSSLKLPVLACATAGVMVLTACGSDGDSSDSSANKTSTGASTSKSASAKPSEPSDAPASESAAPAPAPENGQPAPGHPAPGPIDNPEISFIPQAPVADGAPASAEDQQAIEGLVRGIMNATTVRQFMGYIPQNTCARYLEANGGLAAMNIDQIPDVPLADFPQYAHARPTIDSVTDIQVNGDSASATVTSTADGQTNSAVQRFARENGRWTFCD
ncbi:hypothetical protein BGK38_02735 [Corynebacterium diphtheriae]|uniref:hypothetical protein n=1 Tax=Corynebacterium diphtheriae TaxID=1717 RepID=UPI000245AFBB|nr:hypothetical protein [Corynebacterium diphtheriae]AEX46773.1 putative secreted protein [Corynebacterium diphtheriae INCA 402]ODS20340.1 hypothetical protein BGK38_02735 [Corynebacterium diphtheriae]OEH71224.1 hypothetical protein BHU47_00135 [Corynebacterium diphtheriae]OEH73193.1 hypothetical protein BHU48_09285 [Corynebacterium diphtheriae]OJI02859.1 hypothetical protein BKD75_05700 [Corynebacterium diphtheriae]